MAEPNDRTEGAERETGRSVAAVEDGAAPTAPRAATRPAGAGSPASPRRRAPRPLPSPLAVIAAALGLFFIVLTLLAIQVRNGRDPALGPGPVVPTTSQPVSGSGKRANPAAATKIVTRTSPHVP